ncbi:cation diffusion facilitator family transporter [Thermobacillus composti KWC4]|uniref:Cation diffusion facilitator family transporter n=1 Tax=Thermobacillus composti (strain DSM 18247 / JCM 13945 / KWC4) TaxID=717605 RepID=L0EDB8_THECK|nr:cation diffusion facilitator family transporter [Thermobacillus composti]AGA57777.1 cation diffusion facilitator family transporter [Thermobacillus composti KWC4]
MAHGHPHGHHGHDHHGHHHGHHHHGHPHVHGAGNRAGLTIALAITTGIMVLEIAGGLLTNSLALLSDAGHMFSDAGALALSLLAMRLAARPVSLERSYGFRRFEILAALLNGATLFIMAGFILWEAVERFREPAEVAGGMMTFIAFIGLAANAASAWYLMRKGDVKSNLNVRSAYLHVIGDALGSVGAIAAGLVISLTSWYWFDPLVSVLVTLLIVRSAWGVTRSAVHILMEGTPETIDAGKVRETLLGIDGVLDLHDLHIWTITSGLDALSCHLLVRDEQDEQSVLKEALNRIENRFHIRHATIQIEKSGFRHAKLECH